MDNDRKESLNQIKERLLQNLNREIAAIENVPASLNLSGLLPSDCNQTQRIVHLFKVAKEEYEDLERQSREKQTTKREVDVELERVKTEAINVKENADKLQRTVEDEKEKAKAHRQVLEDTKTKTKEMRTRHAEIRKKTANFEEYQKKLDVKLAEQNRKSKQEADELESNKLKLERLKAKNAELVRREKEEKEKKNAGDLNLKELLANRDELNRTVNGKMVTIKILERQIRQDTQTLKERQKRHRNADAELRDLQIQKAKLQAELSQVRKADEAWEGLVVKTTTYLRIFRDLPKHQNSEMERLNDPLDPTIIMDDDSINQAAEFFRNIQIHTAERRAEQRKRGVETNGLPPPFPKQSKTTPSTSAPTTPVHIANAISAIQRSAFVGVPPSAQRAESTESLVRAPATPELPSNNSNGAAAVDQGADVQGARSRTQQQRIHNPIQLANSSAQVQSHNHSRPDRNAGTMIPPQGIHPSLYGYDYEMLGSRAPNRKPPLP